MKNKVLEILNKYNVKIYEGFNEDDTVFGIDKHEFNNLSSEICKLLKKPKKTSLADIEIKHDKGIDGYQPNDKLDTSKPPTAKEEVKEGLLFFNWVNKNYVESVNGWIKHHYNQWASGLSIEKLYEIFKSI